jgi:hypothetical protein
MADQNQKNTQDNSLPPSHSSKNPHVIEPNVTTHESTEESKKGNKPSKITTPEYRMNKWIMLATVVIAGATLFYVFFSAQQWLTMRDQLSEMQGSSKQTQDLIEKTKTLAENAGRQADNTKTLADTTKDEVSKLKSLVDVAIEQNKAMSKQLVIIQKQYESADRPWLKVDLKTVGPLTFTNQNAYFTVPIRVTMKNVGRSVANKVRFEYDVFLPNESDIIDGPSKRQTIILNRLSSEETRHERQSIFPNEEKTVIGPFGAAITEDFEAPRVKKPTNIVPFVIGCVEYQFASSPNRHYTCFSYTVVRIDPDRKVEKGVIWVGYNLQPENVGLDTGNWGSELAN